MDKTLLWEYTQVKDQIGPCHEEAHLIENYIGSTVRKNLSMNTIENQWRKNILIMALDVKGVEL